MGRIHVVIVDETFSAMQLYDTSWIGIYGILARYNGRTWQKQPGIRSLHCLRLDLTAKALPTCCQKKTSKEMS